MKIRTFNCFVTTLILSILSMFVFNATINADEPSLYEVVWDSPSKNVYETMPLGNGEVAANVWIDETGNLRFYISRIDSIDENGQLLKVGGVKICPTNPPATHDNFKQTLDIKRGILEAVYGNISYKFWIDANRNVIVAEIETKTPQIVTAYNDGWRNERTKYNKYECSDLYNGCPYEDKSFRESFRERFDNLETIIEPDTVLNLPDAIGWYHRNIHSKPYQVTAEVQGTDDLLSQDPLLHRTFGAIIRTERGKKIDDKTLQSTDGTIHRFEIAVNTKHPATADEWLNETQQILNSVQQISLQNRFAEHEKWWNNFCNRSWIHITENNKQVDRKTDPSKNVFPNNKHNFVVGQDQNGGSKFQGQFGRVTLYQKVLNTDEIRKLTQTEPTEIIVDSYKPFFVSISSEPQKIKDSADWKFHEGITVEAWIRPDKFGQYSRIADKITAGKSDGFLFDITPSGGLRLFAGSNISTTDNVLKANEWNHVAATISPDGGIQIYVDGKENVAKNIPDAAFNNLSDAFVVSRAYLLQRYISACAGRGQLAIKYNGSLFTVPEKGRHGNADYRQWGPGYWWQNTRLPYLSMPTAGDFDMMQPFFKQYFEILPFCKNRVKKYFGHGGAYYPECIYFWGDVFLESYGWESWKTREDKLQKSGYHKYEWVGGLEIANMALEYYEYTEDAEFLTEKAIPFAIEILTFFNEHHKTDSNGKLFLSPAQAVETWWDCDNAMPEVAGLHAVVERMERLPENLLTADKRKFVTELKQKLPEIPTTKSPAGNLMLAPGKRFANKRNIENPELYAVYPFRLISYDKPNVEWGVEAFKHRPDRGAFGWRQDDLFAAYLGLTDEAKTHLVKRAKTKHPQSRFPVFWGPNYDWIPDQDHGGVLCKGVQSIVMQCDGKRIDLFPAFPTDWDCDFKLNAPYKTTIEGQLKNGKLINLKVTPKEREKDIILPISKRPL